MLTQERRQTLLELVDRKGGVVISEASRTLGVSEQTVRRDLAHMAERGLVARVHGGAVASLELELDGRGNVVLGDDGQTSAPGVFATGDTVSGASLVVRAIASGRSAAASIDEYLRD